jgi:hypothetical protein
VIFPLLGFSANDGHTEPYNGETTAQTPQHSYTIDGSQSVVGNFTVTAADQVNNADSDTFTLVRDATPPTPDITVPSVAPLTFDVTWSASDAEAGVRHFDVHYKQGAGSWTAWLTATTETSAQFIGQQDESYTFRVRASDNVGNESAWVESASTTVDAVTKYYHHGSSQDYGSARVAMRQGGEVYYLHGDHLGSTSLTTDDQGSVVYEARYLPFGEERWVDGEGVTDFGYTGQRNEGYMELMEMGARWYDPAIIRRNRVTSCIDCAKSHPLLKCHPIVRDHALTRLAGVHA